MRQEDTLRTRLSLGFLVAALIPVFIFASVSQISLRSSLERNLEDKIYGNLRNADQCLNMVLDKYETILYDMCTDDMLIDNVQEIIHNRDDMNVNSSELRRKLSHICNSNLGVEGITIVLKNGTTMFYDRLNSSSTNSMWVDQVSIPHIEKGTVYQGVTSPITANDKQTYLFQIGRRVIDYRNIHEVLGTAVISINENQIRNALATGRGNAVYLLNGDTVISAPDTEDIGEVFTELQDKEKYRYTKTVNEKSGFTIYNEQPLAGYNKAIGQQFFVLAVVAVVSCIVVLFLIFLYTKPYLRTVDSLVDAMNEVESGHFEINVSMSPRMPDEIKRIGTGFNEMVEHIDDLIQQVKTAVVEQKNAELSALEAQIDPHFLYNTLDTINWKAIENEQYDISEMLGALADILRYSVKNAGGVTTVRHELGWLEHYCMLQGAKLGKPLEIVEEVPEALMGYKLHKLLLQPFVENSIKHGFREQEGECCLTIVIRQSDQQVHIMIMDNGKGIEVETLKLLNDEKMELEGHVGIANVRKRLKLYYGDEADVYFESSTEGAKVHLFIPEKEDLR